MEKFKSISTGFFIFLIFFESSCKIRRPNSEVMDASSAFDRELVASKSVPEKTKFDLVELIGKKLEKVLPLDDATLTSLEVKVENGELSLPQKVNQTSTTLESVRSSNLAPLARIWKFAIVLNMEKKPIMRAASKNDFQEEKAGEGKAKAIHHPSLAGYNPSTNANPGVIAAGLIMKMDGHLIFIPDSGNYYKPDYIFGIDEFNAIAKFLEGAGVTEEVYIGVEQGPKGLKDGMASWTLRSTKSTPEQIVEKTIEIPTNEKAATDMANPKATISDPLRSLDPNTIRRPDSAARKSMQDSANVPGVKPATPAMPATPRLPH